MTPIAGLAAAGLAGGPFTPDAVVFTVVNHGSATSTSRWPPTCPGSGSRPRAGPWPAGAAALVTVSLNATAADLANGLYQGLVSFTNLTDGLGSAGCR